MANNVSGPPTQVVPDPGVIDPADVRLAAMNLLARREHSFAELKQKLSRRFDDAEMIRVQLERLAAENLQSDARFARSFIRQCIARGKGPLRIEQDMRDKGLVQTDIDIALVDESPDWRCIARLTHDKKFGSEPPRDHRERARRARFMRYRGFSFEHFMGLLDV